MRLNLLTKILLWVLINLLVLGGVLYFIFNLQFRFSPNSPLLGAADERIEMVAALIARDMEARSRSERDDILRRYSSEYGVEFVLFANSGEQIGGENLKLPPKINERLSRPLGPPPRGAPNDRPLPPPPPPGAQVAIERTSSPTRYWALARVPIREKGTSEPVKASLVAYSDSITGNGLFFNPMPWIFVIFIVFVLSVLIWFPFVRNLNKSIAALTEATEEIANENFEARVSTKRGDEIGRLGNSVNHLAERLSGFVHGQKRFLGDISHELNSPLARMNFAVSILEERVEKEDQKYIDDVREDVELMAKLVDELLTYSKAGMKGTDIQFEEVGLKRIAEEILKRESIDAEKVKIDIEEGVSAEANRNLLSRALSNVVRNAIRYAGDAGEIKIFARRENSSVVLGVSDLGKGVPESEIGKLFDPLYRLERDRARKSGGTGLGLAIVKTCVEACGGHVAARNLKPKGFEVSFDLKSASATKNTN